MAQITWVRPSKTEITTSDTDANIETAARLGWKPKVQEPAQKKAVSKKKAD